MIRLGASARSAIEVEVFDGRDDEHDPPSFATLRACYDDGTITVPADRDSAMALIDALVEVSNSYDAIAEDARRVDGVDAIDPCERRFARAACKALGTAQAKVYAECRKVA